jgi:hypothetical protein
MRDHEPEMVNRLTRALGNRLVSVLSYGPLDPDEEVPLLASRFLLIVPRDLELATLRLLAAPVRWWLKKREPWPRVLSTELLHASSDVYPIEHLELLARRRVLFGIDPITDIDIDRADLRIQCERELREKLMRLREGYIESHGRRDARVALRQLLVVSYASFVRIFRACLVLLGAPAAHHDRDIVTVLCTWLDQPPEPLLAAAQLARHDGDADAERLFADYYRALVVLESRIDRMLNHSPRSTS